jgi:hypothetical protein
VSGVIKGIGKAFKSVLKVAKIVVPIALAAAAIVFTAGAAIPALAGTVLGGGLAGAASGLVTTLGLSTGGVLGGAFAGALTYGAYGAAAGGIISAVSGGSVLKGMQKGALTGAAVGGIAGGTGLIEAAAPTFGPAASSPNAFAPGGGALTGANAPTDPTGAYIPPGQIQTSTLPPAGAPGAGGAVNETSRSLLGKTFGEGGFLQRHGAVLGPVLQGFAAGAADDPYAQALRERDLRYSENYDFRGGVFSPRTTSGLAQLEETLVPAGERFAPGVSSSEVPYRYEYDPAEHKIKKVPVTDL